MRFVIDLTCMNWEKVLYANSAKKHGHHIAKTFGKQAIVLKACKDKFNTIFSLKKIEIVVFINRTTF